MLVANKWMQAVVVVIALCSAQAYATETNEDLPQKKALSKNSAADQKTPAAENDILAGIESENEKPTFEKPTIEKPTFEKPAFEKPKL